MSNPTPHPSQPDFEPYLGLLTKLLKVPRAQRAAITEEMRAHLQEAFDHLLEAGHSPKAAFQLAVDDLGDAAVLAQRLNDISRDHFRRRFLMRVAIPSAVIVTAVLLLSFAFAPLQNPHALQPVRIAAQPEPSGPPTRPAEPEPAVVEPLNSSDDSVMIRMEKRVEVTFVETPLNEAIEFLAEATGVDILVGWESLGEHGLGRDTPVSLQLRRSKPTAMAALKLIFETIAPGIQIKAHKDGFLQITAGQKELETRVYNCRDLLQGMTTEPASHPSIGSTQPVTPGMKLIEVIQSAVPAHQWIAVDGSGGSITEFNGLLVISQDAESHRQIVELLEKLRKANLENPKTAVPTSKPTTSAHAASKEEATRLEPVLLRLRQQLTDLSVKEALLKSKFGDLHPELKETRDMKKLLQQEADSIQAQLPK